MFVNFLLDNIWVERGFKVWVITPLPRFLIAIVIVTSELYAKMLRCCCHKKKQFANDMMDKNTSCYYYFLLQVKDYWIYSFTPTFDHNFISTRDKIQYISNNINIYIYIYILVNCTASFPSTLILFLIYLTFTKSNVSWIDGTISCLELIQIDIFCLTHHCETSICIATYCFIWMTVLTKSLKMPKG